MLSLACTKIPDSVDWSVQKLVNYLSRLSTEADSLLGYDNLIDQSSAEVDQSADCTVD